MLLALLVLTVACTERLDDAPNRELAPAVSETTGAIKISIRDWTGVEGYRLLAGAFHEAGLAGGAFWMMVDADPFTATDIIHPPYEGEAQAPASNWGAGDYVWTESAVLEPGSYWITFWANPGQLAPWGSHLPAEPIERSCSVETVVVAGEVTVIEIGGIPVAGDECLPWSPLPGS